MATKKNSKQCEIIKHLINQHDSIREFSRVINEDPAAVLGWRDGKVRISARAVISLIRNFDGITPNDLRPDIFPDDVKITFKK